jgi:hypothetical protein
MMGMRCMAGDTSPGCCQLSCLGLLLLQHMYACDQPNHAGSHSIAVACQIQLM